eukprot:2177794-Lingulodinium_polyedra.AAC.1
MARASPASRPPRQGCARNRAKELAQTLHRQQKTKRPPAQLGGGGPERAHGTMAGHFQEAGAPRSTKGP